MILQVKNVEYYEWKLSDELIGLLKKDINNATPYQNLIDEFFNPDDMSVTEYYDPYYEFEGVIDELG